MVEPACAKQEARAQACEREFALNKRGGASAREASREERKRGRVMHPNEHGAAERGQAHTRTLAPSEAHPDDVRRGDGNGRVLGATGHRRIVLHSAQPARGQWPESERARDTRHATRDTRHECRGRRAARAARIRQATRRARASNAAKVRNLTGRSTCCEPPTYVHWLLAMLKDQRSDTANERDPSRTTQAQQ